MDESRSTVKPADFEAFWNDVLAQAAKIPLHATMTPVPLRSTPDVEVFDVRYDSLDNVRVAGWYCLPRERSAPLPAMVEYPGYLSEPRIPKGSAALGYAAFAAAPRGKLRSNAQFNPGYPNLLTHNIVDHNTYGYKGFYVDTWRVIDFLLERPEVDGSRIGVRGGSQGGALTLLAAAMRPEIAAASAGSPFLSDVLHALQITNSGALQEINEYLRFHPDSRAAVERTLSYYDCLNFVDKISCPIIMNIGLNDDMCPPETGQAVFDRIGSKQKEIHAYPGAGHDANRPGHEPLVERFFREHLKAGG